MIKTLRRLEIERKIFNLDIYIYIFEVIPKDWRKLKIAFVPQSSVGQYFKKKKQRGLDWKGRNK